MMLNLSNMIKLVDENFVLANKSSQIKNLCSVTEMFNTNITYNDDSTIEVTTNGKTKEKTTVDCSLAFDPWNQRSIKKLSAIK